MIWTDNLNPIALSLGFIQIRWYGVFYLIAFLLGFFWLKLLVKKKLVSFSAKQIDDLLFGMILGVILGGRIGYFLLYKPAQFLSPELFEIWHGGMSFHGGLVGVLVAIFWLAHKWQKSFFEISDIVVILAAVGIAFGRLGNFVNGELVGRPTGGDWGVIFPSFDATPRFPSQLFEAAKNLGIAGLLLLIFRTKPRQGILSFAFLTFYGLGRTLVEIFWREPLDGFIFGLPKGAIYSLPLFFIGVSGIIWLLLKSERRT
ncbi:MAG: prolipoprotein diacylglyceryl transferase [Patescibacteria group bacterium]